jgi:Nicastrin
VLIIYVSMSLSSCLQFIEMGPVGNASLNLDTQQLRLYAHTEKGPSGDASQDILNALQTAATSPSSSSQTELENMSIDVQPASETTPGLPPSSASSFLRMKSSLPALYIAEFNEAYVDEAFNTQFDTGMFWGV